MFMTKPAITEPGLYAVSGWEKNKYIKPIACGSGITIGQLADAQEKRDLLHADYDEDRPMKVCKKSQV